MFAFIFLLKEYYQVYLFISINKEIHSYGFRVFFHRMLHNLFNQILIILILFMIIFATINLDKHSIYPACLPTCPTVFKVNCLQLILIAGS